MFSTLILQWSRQCPAKWFEILQAWRTYVRIRLFMQPEAGSDVCARDALCSTLAQPRDSRFPIRSVVHTRRAGTWQASWMELAKLFSSLPLEPWQSHMSPAQVVVTVDGKSKSQLKARRTCSGVLPRAPAPCSLWGRSFTQPHHKFQKKVYREWNVASQRLDGNICLTNTVPIRCIIGVQVWNLPKAGR